MDNDQKELYFEQLNSVTDFTGEISTKVLVKFDNFSSTLICMANGQAIDTHNSKGDACIQVLRGKGTFRSNGQSKPLEAGMFVFTPAHVNHSIVAEEEFAFLLCLTHHVPLEYKMGYEDSRGV